MFRRLHQYRAAFDARLGARGRGGGHVYLHFSDKEEMFRAAVTDDYDLLGRKLGEAARLVGTDPFARLRAISHAYCRFALDHPGRYRLIAQVQQAIPEGGPRPQGHPAGPVHQILLKAVRQCQAAGSASNADTELLVTCLRSGLHGFLELRGSKPQRKWPSLDAIIERLTASLLLTPVRQSRPSPSSR